MLCYFTFSSVQLHPVLSVLGPLCTFLRMNDCTLPIHLNSTLHITSTLIWQLSVFFFVCFFSVCLFVCFSPFASQLLFHDFHWCCCDNSTDPVAEMTFPRRWPAFYDDCKKWKCFTTHFRTFVVINKTALNYICVAFRLLFFFSFLKTPNNLMNVENFFYHSIVWWCHIYTAITWLNRDPRQHLKP